MDLDALHYKFEMRERVTMQEAAELMQKMGLTITIKEEVTYGKKGTDPK